MLTHAAVIIIEVASAAWALRRFRAVTVLGAALAAAAVLAGSATVPSAVVVAGHVAAFLGVIIACGWAFSLRLIARADFVTLPAIVVASAAVSAGLVTEHGDMPGPMPWIPWAALGSALGFSIIMLVREQLRHRAALEVGRDRLLYLEELRAVARPARSDIVPLRNIGGVPEVTEASPDELRLLRYLMSVALQPIDKWDSYDRELPGPLGKYRYQVNALAWGLATFGYAHTPSFSGALLDAQVALIERLQHKTAWGYWYWQNLLGNLDLAKRRADPIDVPQNIMFSGYLNLQLGMFHQATGDRRFDEEGSIVFDWSSRQRFAYDHRRINHIVVRNFGQDLCLWPCEPMPLGLGRKRGFVFPYCNAVAAAGLGVMDGLAGTQHASEIAARLEDELYREFATAKGDLVAFMVSGVGLSARVLGGPTTTAGIAALLAPLRPDLAWRSWEILRRDWLDSGLYRKANSAGGENPDWGTGAKTNAEPLAAAMLLARECGEDDWHAELWRTALDQMRFAEDADQPGVWTFAEASVHANGMLGFGGFGRGHVLTDMMTRRRPEEWTNGPRLAELPHPTALVAKAVTDGSALDLVLRPGLSDNRVALRVDQLRPHQRYVVAGTVEHEVVADEMGQARLTVDLDGRTALGLRPA